MKVQICQSSKYFRHMKILNNLTDTYKFKNLNTVSYTYVHPTQHERNSRIDFTLASSNLVEFITNSNTCYAPAPDHNAVYTTINILQHNQGKGLWKLNNSMVDEVEYKLLIRQLTAKTNEEYSNYISSQSLLELLKIRIKEQTIRYCINQSKYMRHENNYLNKKKVQKLLMINFKCYQIGN